MKLVTKELLAAEGLTIRIIQPALAQDFIGEIIHMLQDRQARHESRGKRRLASVIRYQDHSSRPVRINGAEDLFQEIPVDCASKFRKRTIHIDDLIEPRLE